MAITKKQAAKEVGRWSGLPFFDMLDKRGLAELVTAMQAARDEAHAAAAASEIAQMFYKVPTPREVHETLAAKMPVEGKPAASDCPRCHGSGTYSRDEIRRTINGPLPVAVSGPCGCRGGA